MTKFRETKLLLQQQARAGHYVEHAIVSMILADLWEQNKSYATVDHIRAEVMCEVVRMDHIKSHLFMYMVQYLDWDYIWKTFNTEPRDNEPAFNVMDAIEKGSC